MFMSFSPVMQLHVGKWIDESQSVDQFQRSCEPEGRAHLYVIGSIISRLLNIN